MEVYKFITALVILVVLNACTKENEPYFVQDTQGIFIYSSPDLSAKILKRVAFNAPVNVLETHEDGWMKISSAGIKGYTFRPPIKTTMTDLHLYVDSLDGIKIYEKPTEKSKVIDIVVHKTRLKIHEIDQAEGTYKKLQWALVEVANITGYARIEYMSPEPKSYFYSIVREKGQSLRSKPEENAPILTSLPLNHIGEILEKSTLTDNSSAKGYWFRTEYKGKMGWILSNYTVTSIDRKYLEDRDYIRNEEWFMRYMDSPAKLEVYHMTDKEFSIANKDMFEVGNFEVYYLRFKHDEDDCSVSSVSKIVFKNKFTSQFYSLKGLYSEDLVSLDKPFGNTVYTKYESCHCCCPDSGNLLYFILDDSVYYIHYKAENLAGSCLYGPIEGVELERENRFEPDKNTIYMNLRLPLCEPSLLNDGTNKNPVGYAHNLFAILKKEKNKISVEKFYDSGIPEKYREAWENATLNYEITVRTKE